MKYIIKSRKTWELQQVDRATEGYAWWGWSWMKNRGSTMVLFANDEWFELAEVSKGEIA